MSIASSPERLPGPASPALRQASAVLAVVDRLILAFAAALTGVFVGCVIIQIAVRYLFEFPAPWTEELSRYAFVWASFLAAAPIVGSNQHFMIDMLVESLSGTAKRICLILATLCTLVFTMILVIWGFSWAWRMVPVTSAVLEVSQGAIYGIVPAAGAYMSIHSILRLLRLLDPRDQDIIASPLGGEDPC